MNFTCILIGENNILIECGLYLLKKQHSIRGVVSSEEVIQNWCKQNKIDFFASLKDVPSSKTYIVDYLFSIVNSIVLKPSHLHIARYGGINYHDSRLPHYAGVNATTWVLMNGEKKHGITWHRIDEGIDSGDILYQTEFPISEKETALSLNLRCFEEAIKGFSTIIDNIESSSLNPTSQKNDQRSYYGRTHVLSNLGFIAWETEDAMSIERKARALNFGSYYNPVGSLKIYLKDTYLIVSDVVLIEKKGISKGPGCILDITQDGILVNTLSDPIFIKILRLPMHNNLNLDGILHQSGFGINDTFPTIPSSLVSNLNSLYGQGLKHEKYWTQILSNISDHSLFSDRQFNKNSGYIILQTSLQNKPDPSNLSRHSIQLYLFTTIMIYLFRMNNYTPLTVFLLNPSLNIENNPGTLFSNLLPIAVDLKNPCAGDEILDACQDLLDSTLKHKHYLTDIFARNPKLTPINDPMITLNFSTTPHEKPKNSLIHFEVDEHANEIKIFHKIDVECQGGTFGIVVSNIIEHLNNLFQYLLNNTREPIHQFCFLSHKEKEEIIHLSTGPYIPLPNNTIENLIERTVKHFPNAIALYHSNFSMTYDELWKRSEYTKMYLTTLKLIPGTHIGLLLTDPVDTLIIMLGILKADLVSVPLDIQNMSNTQQIINTLSLLHCISKEAKNVHIDKNIAWYTQSISSCEESSAKVSSPAYKLVCEQMPSPTTKSQLERRRVYTVDEVCGNNTPYPFNTFKVSQESFQPPSGSPHPGSPQQRGFILALPPHTHHPVFIKENNMIDTCFEFISKNHLTAHSSLNCSEVLAQQLLFSGALSPLLVGGSILISRACG